MTTQAGWQDELGEAWREIEDWYAARGASHLLADGARDEEIAKAERSLGLRFPEQLRASLRRHNGSEDEGWANGTLLSAGKIVAATELRRKAADSEEYAHFAAELVDGQKVQPVWWHRGWVAIDEDPAGNATAVDTEPAPAGAVGQIVDVDHVLGPASVYAQDVTEFLREVLDSLQELRVVDGERLEEDDVWDGEEGLDGFDEEASDDVSAQRG